MDFDQNYSGLRSNHEHNCVNNKILRSSSNFTPIFERQFGNDVNFNLTFGTLTIITDEIYQDSGFDEIYCTWNNDHPSRILFRKTYFTFAEVYSDQGFNAYVASFGHFSMFV